MSSICVKDFGRSGKRVAYREGSVDEAAIAPWVQWLSHPVPRPHEPQPGDVILDVGAHIGGFTLAVAGLVPEGRVLAVEAARESYELLTQNVQQNQLTNVETSHLALSARTGQVRLHHNPKGNWGHTITTQLDAGGESVPTETLAGYLRDHAVRHCDLAKFNCEGAEFPILMSASAETLRTIRKMFILYHEDLVDENYGIIALEGHLEDAGFALKRNPTSTVRGTLFARLGAARNDE